MASWYPATPLEEEIVSLQPDHNFIYGELTDQEKRRVAYQPRPQEHLDYLQQKSKTKAASNEFEMPGGCSLSVIRAVHEIAGTKQGGINASIDDWNTRENAGKETIAMIRHFGMGPSVDFPLNKKLTKPTLPFETNVTCLTKNDEKSFPVLLNSDSFKIVSTRMRNAELAKGLVKSVNDLDTLKTEDIKPLRCEEEVVSDTLESMYALEIKAFDEGYPTLGQQKAKTKKKQKNAKAKQETENWFAQEPENWRCQNSTFPTNSYATPRGKLTNLPSQNSTVGSKSYSTPTGDPNFWRTHDSQSAYDLNFSNASTISASSDSSFYSLNTSNSGSYASAKEFAVSSHSNNSRVHKTAPTYANVTQNSKMSKESNENHSLKESNARLYKPKDVYKTKNSKRRM